MTEKSTKKLIVNADDFGLTPGVNQGIIHCFNRGIVKSASLMANGMAFEGAVALSRENPGLGIGWHIVLVGEEPVSYYGDIKSLAISKGRLLDTYVHFMARYFSGRIKLSEVRRELEAQLLKILDNGISVDHIDSHQFIHMLPGILRIVIDLARKYEIKFIRFPRKELFQVFNIKGIGLYSLSWVNYLNMRNSGLKYADRLLGLRKSCQMNEFELLRHLGACEEGVNELMCHPGFIDEAYKKSYSHWRANCPEGEVSALTGEQIKGAIKSLNIELINFRFLGDRS